MVLNLDKQAQEANTFINKLAADLGHPNEVERTGIILRAILHTLRDRITISESFDLMAQLPMFLKAIYVDQWKYSDQPKTYKSIEDFKNEVKRQQEMYGEQEFNWKISTQDIIQTVFKQLKENYLSDGEMGHILSQLPGEIEELVK